ncbi:hypothetical protein DXT91_18205 [Agrobacterium tumefaciens]|nr:hypothetical protein [Agrobacterium tumefaciens]
MPRFSSLCLSEHVLQSMRFGEIERSTTNQILSLLQSRPEDFACQTPKYESDVLLSQSALGPCKTQNASRFVVEQQHYRLGERGGGKEEIKNSNSIDYSNIQLHESGAR